MPSPFPGMDPYLEGSEWTSVHAELAGEIAKQLVPKVAPKYTVRPVRRFIMDTSTDVAITKHNTYPDVGVYHVQEVATPYHLPTLFSELPLLLDTVMSEQIPITSIEIRDRHNRELVTAIELISPTNKRGTGYQEYVEKRSRLLHSTTHLLEIDLHRQGLRIPMRQPLPEADYFVFLSRAGKRPVTEVWPLTLAMPLPTIPVPLLPEDGDVPLDLQQSFTTAYESYRYDLSIIYSQPPEIPLEGEWANWANELLVQAGLR